MTALKVIGIILLVFLLLGFLRVGALISFDEALCVKLRIGALRLTLYPKAEKKPAAKEKSEEKSEEKKGKRKEKNKAGKKHSIPKPTLEELIDLVRTALSALGAMIKRACSRVRIDPLEATVVLGGNDPSAVAFAYGAASSAMFALMPKAEETFYIPDPSLHLRMDFSAQTTTVRGRVGISLRVCDLFAILFTLILPLGKWFLRLKRAHKHDPGNPAEQAKEQAEQTKEKIA